MTAKILFVDDEKNILKSVKRLLLNEPFSLYTTTSPKEGLHLIENEEFSLIITDHRMPEMTGIELLEKAKTAAPDSIRVLITGYTDTNIAIEAINRGSISWFFPKPWENSELLQSVRYSVLRYQIDEKIKELPRLFTRLHTATTEEGLFNRSAAIFTDFLYPRFSSVSWFYKSESSWHSLNNGSGNVQTYDDTTLSSLYEQLQDENRLSFDRNNRLITGCIPSKRPGLFSLSLDDEKENIDAYLGVKDTLWLVLEGLLLTVMNTVGLVDTSLQ